MTRGFVTIVTGAERYFDIARNSIYFVLGISRRIRKEPGIKLNTYLEVQLLQNSNA